MPLERELQSVNQLVEAGALGRAVRVLREPMVVAPDAVAIAAAPALFPSVVAGLLTAKLLGL